MVSRKNRMCFCNIILIAATVVLSIVAVNGQTDYQYRVFTQEDGLASSTIQKIIQDSTGYLWLLSENSLLRFDGYAFKLFNHETDNDKSISSAHVYSILTDDNKNMFFSTENSVSRYHPSSNTFENYYTFQNRSDIKSQFITADGIWLIKTAQFVFINSKSKEIKNYFFPAGFALKSLSPVKEINATIWLSNGKSILYFNSTDSKFTSVSVNYLNNSKINQDPYPLQFFSDEKNQICFFSKKGLFRFNKTLNGFYQYMNLEVTEEPENLIKRVFLFNKKYVVVAYRLNKFEYFDLSNGKKYLIALNATDKNEPVPIFETTTSQNGTLWVSTTNQGVYQIDFDKQAIVNHLYHDEKNKNSLESNNIEFMLENENVLWLTSPGLGLIKAEPNQPLFKAYRPGNTASSSKSSYTTNIRAIAELDKTNLLLGTLEGLLQFNKISHTFSNVISPDGKSVLKNTAVSAICTDTNHTFYFSNWGSSGITIINYQTKKETHIDPYADEKKMGYRSIRSMFIDTHNFLWIGTSNNIIFRLDLKSLAFNKTKTYTFEKFIGGQVETDTFNFNITFAFAENKKNQVLIGTENGLHVYDYTTKKLKHFLRFQTIKKSASSCDIRSFCIDKSGEIWIGTNGNGLLNYDEQFNEINSFSKENGLPDNSIYSLLEDKNGNLWLGTNRGICRFDSKKNTIRNYSLKDGIQNYEFNTNAAYKTSDDEFVFGGVNGFNIFYPDSIKANSAIPKVVISEFKVNDQNYPLSELVTLNYKQNSISFQFAALSYFRNGYNLYAYKLDGVNADWVFCDNRRFSNYAGLAPGDYTFHVKACNYNGVWNNAGASLKFSISPPFWNTLWFKLSVLITVIFLVYLLFRYRLKQKLNVELLRSKIARDLHDEIGSNLTSISLFSAVAKEKTLGTPIAPLLQKISDYTQTSQEAMNDIVWMINAGNDSFEKIIVRMRKRAAETFESTNVIMHINLDEQLNSVKIGMEERKNFYLIYKESLNNVIKYADCKNIWIDLTTKHSSIILKIRDDGKGFDTSYETKGNGMINMKKRAELLKGKLQIQSTPGQGTTLQLTFSS